MTPQELARIRAMIDEAVEAALSRVVTSVVQPLRDDVDVLKRAADHLEREDRKHSGVHRDLLAGVDEVRRTGEHAKLETTEYIARTLDAFRKEMLEAAQRAPAQVEATKAATEAVQTAATKVETKNDETVKKTRQSTAVTLIAMVIIAVLNHFLKG